MDMLGFQEYLVELGTEEDQVEFYLNMAHRFNKWRLASSPNIDLNQIEPAEMDSFAEELITKGENTWENFLALVRYAKFCKDFAAYLAIVERIDGSEVMDNLHDKVGRRLGEDIRDHIFSGINLPPMGMHPTQKAEITEKVMERLEAEVDPQTCRELLKDSLRHLQDEPHLVERRRYMDCEGLDEYLSIRGGRFIADLEAIQSEGGLFFTQPVTEEVIEFVRGNPEIGQGVRQGDTLYQIKIPYMTADYLAETDEQLKRFYYCHCPWVRQGLINGRSKISSTFCNCSAGFMKKPWEVIFEQPLEAEMVETILDGDPWCKVAIRLPEGV